jgi:hypothetical protein
MLITMSVAMMLAGIWSRGYIAPVSTGHAPAGMNMNEVEQPRPIRNASLIRGVVICGAMLLIALLFGSVPLFFSYRKTLST